jgi:hypothetical protein
MAIATFGALAASAAIGGNLVQNGGFELSSYPYDDTEYYWSNGPTGVADWTAYSFGYEGYQLGAWFPATRGTGFYNVPTSYEDFSTVAGNYVAPGASQTDPAGGYFLLLDGEPPWLSGIYQNITGLTVGDKYELTFYWGATDLVPDTQAFSEDLAYTLGGDLEYNQPLTAPNYVTQTISEPVYGFSGWLKVSQMFTATATSEFLEFAAEGGPYGAPSSSLIDGVSLTYVPEPSTWALMILGVGAVGGLARRRRMRRA